MIMQYKRKLKGWNCTKGKKRQISKSVGMWFNAIALYGHVTGDVVKLHFGADTEKRLEHFLLTQLPDGGHTSFPLFYSLSFLPRFLFLLPWLKLFWVLFPFSSDEIILRQFQFVLAANSAYSRANLLALDFSPNDPIGSRQNWKNTWPFEYKNPAHSHNIHLLATTSYPISPRRNSLPSPSHR